MKIKTNYMDIFVCCLLVVLLVVVVVVVVKLIERKDDNCGYTLVFVFFKIHQLLAFTNHLGLYCTH